MPQFPRKMATDDEVAEAMRKVKQSDRLTVTSTASEWFVFIFPTPYQSPPNIYPQPTYSGPSTALVRIEVDVKEITATQCSARLIRTRPTILATLSTFEVAPIGTVGAMQVVGVYA